MLTNEQIQNINKWIDALLSGKYTQAECVLNNLDTGGMCCLGVYADAVSAVAWVPGIWEDHNVGTFVCNDIVYNSMPGNLVTLGTGLNDAAQIELADMNDKGKDFPTIVERIRQMITEPVYHEGNTDEEVALLEDDD